MKVFKFGGAVIKDAVAVRDLEKILRSVGDQLVVVISAMGKTTNALERVVDNYFYHKSALPESLNFVKDYHYAIINDLFPDKSHSIYSDIGHIFKKLQD
jgi:aspartate kinase